MKPLSTWTENDLRALIEQQSSETLQREYKKQFSIERSADKKELCKDVSAFANSQGGIIIFGLEEAQVPESGSIPIALNPISDRSLKERAQQLILDGIQPRLEFKFYSIPNSSGNAEYVIIDVPKSFRGPHMVTSGGDSRYYIRRDF